MTTAVIAGPKKPTPAEPFPAPPAPPFPGPDYRSQQPTCPTCGGPVGSLLTACFATKACLTNDLDYDALCARWEDQ